VIIWFDGDRAVIPVDQLASDVGIDATEALDALAQLEAHGFLQRRDDGSYDATIPDVGGCRGQ
jgi:hypothetical protein